MPRAGFYTVESGKISFRRDGNWYSDDERIDNPRIALLFLVPGLDETLRVFGTAEIVAGADFGNDLISNGRAPQTVLKIAVWTIKDGRDGRDLATGRLLTTAPVQDGDAAGSVALSQNLGEMSRQIAERIVELNAIPKPRAPLTSKAVD